MRIQTLLITAAALVFAACQTVEGFGEDVEAGGQAIQETSDDVQGDI